MGDDDISYEGLDEAGLVLALYRGTRAIGMGLLHVRDALTLEEVRADIVAAANVGEFGIPPMDAPELRGPDRLRFDYYRGRPLKIVLDRARKVLLGARLYDRDAGAGRCAEIVAELRGRDPGARVTQPETVRRAREIAARPPAPAPRPLISERTASGQTRARFYSRDGFMEWREIDPIDFPIFKLRDIRPPDRDSFANAGDAAPYRSITGSIRTYEREEILYPWNFCGPIELEAVPFEYKQWIEVGPDDEIWYEAIYDERINPVTGRPIFYTRYPRVEVGQAWPLARVGHRVFRYYEVPR